MDGYIHNYTGTGKGKTTSALGLALRSLGAGKKVCIIQFFKNGDFSEVKALNKLKEVYGDSLYFIQSGADRVLFSKISERDKVAARKGEKLFFHLLNEGAYDLYILDEINTAAHYGLINPKEFINGVVLSNSSGELVMTGRYAPRDFIDFSDLVTNMEKIKHYADQGVKAREGIEF